jgi:hypothetical protein
MSVQADDVLLAPLHEQLAGDGFAFAKSDTMARLLGPLPDFDVFAASWERLAPDAYLAARGRQRRRRHATFHVDETGTIAQAPHQAHYQSLAYNPLQGDIARWFEPVEPAIAGSATLGAILRLSHHLFASLAPAVPRWHVELHQFRIEAAAGAAGEPTPEGSHRDGVDYVLVLMIDRQNIARGTTTIHSADGVPLGDFTLAAPLDAALVDDHRVFHGVTPVEALDPAQPAHRDVLVVTFRATRTG